MPVPLTAIRRVRSPPLGPPRRTGSVAQISPAAAAHPALACAVPASVAPLLSCAPALLSRGPICHQSGSGEARIREDEGKCEIEESGREGGRGMGAQLWMVECDDVWALTSC